MSTLNELLTLKEIYARKAEQSENAVKFYEEEITKMVKESNEETKFRKATLVCDKSIELYLDGEVVVSFVDGQEVYVLYSFECDSYVDGKASVIFDGEEAITVSTVMLTFKEEN